MAIGLRAAVAATIVVSATPAIPCADVALVLALDVSGSIDDAEFRLQAEGLAAAFRDPAVRAAIATAGDVRIAALFWAGPDEPHDLIGWRRIAGPADAEALADEIAVAPRRARGATDIAAALDAALDLLAAGQDCVARRMINVSGDGEQTPRTQWRLDTPLPRARARATEAGVVVNGLAVGPGAELAEYYRREVATGPGAFVMTVTSIADFPEAIRRKLLLELALPMVASATR